MLEDKNNKEDIDLSGVFKGSESSVKSQEKRQLPTQVFLPGTPKMVQWTIKYSGGLIKNEKQASCVLIGFVIVAIVISLVLIFGGSKSATREIFTPPAEEYIPYP